MAHSFTCTFMHIIFSTKERRPLLTPDIRLRLFDYMGGTIRGLKGTSLLVNGVDDHVHTLAIVPATMALSDFMREYKAGTSSWAKRAFEIPGFGWQTGYAAFSVSKSSAPSVQRYIAEQEEHHRKVSFREEYLKFLHAHEVEFDERFVFD